MLKKFERLESIVGDNNLDKKCVLVVGLGGVGGYVVESIARCGIGSIILVDFDKVDQTNINRQIIALDSTIGKHKTDLFEKRIKDINKECKLIKYNIFLDENNINQILNTNIDFIVDACDTVKTKKLLIEQAQKRKINIISSMGTGNKLTASLLEIVDISKTVNDPLARIFRKYCKDNKIKKLTVLSSKELPIKPNNIKLGSSIFVPAVGGLLIGNYVIKELLKK